MTYHLPACCNSVLTQADSGGFEAVWFGVGICLTKQSIVTHLGVTRNVPVMPGHTCNPSTQEASTGRLSPVLSQFGVT